jgi:hypothetical protein
MVQVFNEQTTQAPAIIRTVHAGAERFSNGIPAAPQRIVMHPVSQFYSQTTQPTVSPVTIQVDVSRIRSVPVITQPPVMDLRQKQLEEALRAFESAFTYPPSHFTLLILCRAAEIMRQCGDLNMAEIAFSRACSQPGGEQNLFALSHHAETLRQLRKYRASIFQFEKALALPGGKADPFTVQGYEQACFQQSRLEQMEAASSLLNLSKGFEASLS